MIDDKKGDYAGTNESNSNRAQHAGLDDKNKKASNEEAGLVETEVKNANAAGVGALGRNDEKLTENNGSTSGEAGDY